MESSLSFFRMHWDHEPHQLVGRGVLTAPRLGGLGTARPTLWFMESPLSLCAFIGSMNRSSSWNTSTSCCDFFFVYFAYFVVPNRRLTTKHTKHTKGDDPNNEPRTQNCLRAPKAPTWLPFPRGGEQKKPRCRKASELWKLSTSHDD